MKQLSIPADISESAIEEAIILCYEIKEIPPISKSKCDSFDVYISREDMGNALRLMNSINSISGHMSPKFTKVIEVKDYRFGEWLMCVYFDGELKDTVYNPPS